MSKDDDRLVRLIRSKSREKCLAFFSGMDAKERRRFAKLAQRMYRDIDKEWLNRSGSDDKPFFGKPVREQLDNARVCVIATATPAELRTFGWRIVPDGGFVVNVVRDVQPDWIDQWVQDLSETEPRMYHDIRLLYDAGLCEKPAGDGYILGMIEGLPGWRVAPSSLWDKQTPLAERIRKTPDIRNDDVWRLFEVEGGGDLSLSAFDKYIAPKIGGWSAALIELSADGTLSRDRLLDESLNALEKDFAQFRAGWFSRFHEAMQPSLEERATRRGRYLQLLGSSIPPTVSFALKAVLQLDKAERLPPGELIDRIPPVLQARAKGTVSSGLRLIANAAKREPGLSAAARKLITTALIHEAADVQKKALDMIDSLGGADDQGIAATLADYADGIAPSLQDRFRTMMGGAEVSPPAGSGERRVAETSVSDIDPIASFDELNQAFLRVLEDTSRPLQIERVLDGLARFGAEQPKDFAKLAGPLRKRASAIIKRQADDQLQYQLARLAQAFTSSEPLSEEDTFRYPNVDIAPYSGSHQRERRSFEDVFVRRGIELLAQVRAGHRLPLLSAPTDSRGFVAAGTLLARYAGYKAKRIQPGQLDTVLALMRLSPDGRSDVLKTLSPDDEHERAFAFALGAEISVGRTDWLWVAAAAARLPYSDEPEISKRHGSGYPDAGTKARYSIGFERTKHFTWLRLRVEPRIQSDVPSAFLPTLFHLTSAGDNGYGAVCGYHVNMIRWCSTIWPLNPEPFFSQGVLVFDHNQRLANSPYAGFLEPMLESHIAIGETGTALLALGLASCDPAVKSVALEAAIASIDENRLDLEHLQHALSALIPSGHVPLGRWTKSLTELSGVSTRHAEVVRKLLEGSLCHDPSKPPRDIGGLIELLYELTVALDQPVSSQSALDYLHGVQGGGKAKRFAGKLIARAGVTPR